jgi:hypothetical protein
MKNFYVAFCLILFAAPAATHGQYTDLSEYGYYTNYYFSTPSISPAPVISGRSGAMASLEFTVRDSVRDVFMNPAKFYGGRSVFISPSVANQSLSAERAGITLHQYENDFRTYTVPAGGSYTAGNFYAGGMLSYANFSRDEKRYGGSMDLYMHEKVSGTQFEMFTGYRFSDRFSLAVSYQGQNYSRSRFNENRAVQRSDHNSASHGFNAGKLGAFLQIGSGQAYFLTTLYRNNFEDDLADSIGNYWQHVTGYQLRAEHLHPISRALSIGALISFENRDFLNRTAENYYTDYKNRLRTIQLGTGLHGATSAREFGLEIVYQPVRSVTEYQQPFSDPDGFYDFNQSIEENRLILRGGIDQNVWDGLRLQGGLSYTIAPDRELSEESLTNVPDQNIFNEDRRNEMIQSWNRTLLSAGFSYSFRQVSINYYSEIFFNDPDSNDPRTINQLLLQYTF